MTEPQALSRHRFVEVLSPTPKTQTEFDKRKRLLAESDGVVVVEWLNTAKGTPAYRRVLALRRELGDVGAALNDLRHRLIDAVKTLRTSPQKMDEVNRLREKFRKRHNALNRILSRYTHVPALAYSVETGVWRFGMIPKHRPGPEVKLSDQRVTIRANESSVSASLVRLAANRELSKIRLCAKCAERWVFARRPQLDKFCTDKCRVSFHVHSEQGKLNHRKAQAEYRNRLRERAVNE